MTTLKRDLWKEQIGHLDRQKLIDYGKMRADQSARPVTLGIDVGVIKMILTHAAAVHHIRIHATRPRTFQRIPLFAATGFDDRLRLWPHLRPRTDLRLAARIAGHGIGDTRWKVPGVLNWSTGIYNPRVDVKKDTTTLYAFSCTLGRTET